ncbi:MAG: 23S rRNA (adenine(2503)-C(2))-methyltransferase RlmN [Hydrogenobacter thermophilus]|uniref:23S rRNA (adenine(2503)-C(2))-methyltransferase RlmN n=1 Tax=Hydrogenobacter thermophilus TaxID=940 RepID=UPI001C740F95|nr:23S rRNA (adenine(2503)-C(2))-methyltransferase RlmN [Hydrogenobacter thermophilus]QWK19884.1 MAG: 23S rRNA (adenine(2503)-C(2))-methyltransferase RlmN [Hydrogenobacter thermophilus]
MECILSYNLEELKESLSKMGMPKYRAVQVLGWVYKKFQTDFDAMTDISKEDRKLLKENYYVHSLELVDEVHAEDSVKYLFKTLDGHTIESVLIREKDHLTLCVSSQIGCAVGCKFCATAIDGLVRNLRSEEILDQLLQIQKKILPQRIRNVVFMGMGEPLANYENVRKAVEVMVSPWGIDLSKRRISVSTSGLIAQIKRMSEDPIMREVNLAVSLNAPSQKLRELIMPISKTNHLPELMQVLKEYPYPKGRRIMLEYVLIKGLNDKKEDALSLAQLIGKYKNKFKVNLIPYNPYPELPYERPSMEGVYEFQKVLWQKGISTFVRLSKGINIFGACGQLRQRDVVKWKEWKKGERAGLQSL